MIAFDVFVNRQKIARAGVGSDGVLTAMVTGYAGVHLRNMHILASTDGTASLALALVGSAK
jgi:hypothetical protein